MTSRCARSPAAPAHHFEDAQGLLTAVATLAFSELTTALREGHARGGADPQLALREQGIEYVRFALRNPGPFRLMFRDGINKDDALLAQQANEAFAVLADGVRAALGLVPGAAGDLAQREVIGPALGEQRLRRLDQRVPQVAVVVGLGAHGLQCS